MQDVQSYCFCPLNVKICDVLVAVAVVVGGDSYSKIKVKSKVVHLYSAFITRSQRRFTMIKLPPADWRSPAKSPADLELCGRVRVKFPKS